MKVEINKTSARQRPVGYVNYNGSVVLQHQEDRELGLVLDSTDGVNTCDYDLSEADYLLYPGDTITLSL